MIQNPVFRNQKSERAVRWARHLPLMMLLLVIGLLIFLGHAYAQTPPIPGASSSCSGYPGVANRVAGCILESIHKSALVFFYQFYPYIANAIAAVTILGVVFYGILVSFSMVQSINRDTVMLLIKIGAVSFFTQSADVMYSYVYSAMNAASVAVVKVVPASGNADGSKDFSNIVCLKNMHSASQAAGKPVAGPWVAIDCMLDTVIGIKTQSNSVSTAPNANLVVNPQLSSTNNTVSRGLLYFFFVNLGSSIVGMILGIIGLLFLWSLITLTIRTLLTFIMGYMAVTFLIIISPLIIPMVLLPGEAPKTYFEKWYKLLIGFSMQPVLMVLFISMFVCAVDLAMFSSDYSIVYRIAGEASRQPGFDINRYLTTTVNAVNKKPITLYQAKVGTNHPGVAKAVGNALVNATAEQKQCGAAVLMTGGTQHPSCKNVAPVQFMLDALDWQKLADARNPPVVMEGGATTTGQALLREVLAASIFCAVILFVMNRFAAIVPNIVTDLTGESIGPAKNNLANHATGSIEQGLGKLISRIKA